MSTEKPPQTKARRHASEYTDDVTLQCELPNCRRKKKPGYRYCAPCKYTVACRMAKKGYFRDELNALDDRRDHMGSKE